MTSQTLLILGSCLCPPLRSILLSLVPSQPALDKILDNVIQEVQSFRHLAPSLNLAADIIKEARDRQKSYMVS